MNTYRPNNVVIIGAGITGLITGILLKQQGISVKIYEKRMALESIGGSLSIWPVGSKVLLNLSCASDVLKLAGDLRFENWGLC
jgi:FAD-dependent urate hydroxylase